MRGMRRAPRAEYPTPELEKRRQRGGPSSNQRSAELKDKGDLRQVVCLKLNYQMALLTVTG